MGQSLSSLVKGFRDAGIEQGDSILVHSSLSSLGWVDGGAETVVDALIQSVTDSGTVLFPTLTGRPEDGPDHPPTFDVRHTIPWTGHIPNTARQRPNAIRSLHPTHSVAAIGMFAEWFTAGHEFVRTPCGHGSPYGKLADVGGKIVLIGVTQCANTSFHHAEELAGVSYVCLDTPMDITMTGLHGDSLTIRDTFLHRWGAERDFDYHERAMIDLGICRVRQVGEASVRVIDANLQRVFLVRKLLADPLATLSNSR